MARVNNRGRKAKPSKKSKARRREFLKNQKMRVRREFVAKEKEATETVNFLHSEIKSRESDIAVLRQRVVDERKEKCKEIKEKLNAKNAEWKEKLQVRDEKTNRLWANREKKIREEEWSEREREKQELSTAHARMIYEMRHERKELDARVDELEGENEELKEKMKDLEDQMRAMNEKFMGYRG